MILYAHDILHNYNVVIVNVDLKCKYNLTELIGMTIFTEINSATFCVLSKLLFRPSSSYQQTSCEALVTICCSCYVLQFGFQECEWDAIKGDHRLSSF